MKSNPFRAAILFLAVITLATVTAISASATAASAGGSDTWMKVFGTGTELMRTVEGKTFHAGYLVGSGLIMTRDKNFLAAAYVRGDEQRPVDLALIKFDGSGSILSYKEYRSPRRRIPAERYAGDLQSWASLAPTPDGGAVVAFDTILMKVGREGKPVWSMDYQNTAPTPSKDDGQKRAPSRDFVFKSVLVLKSGDIIVCGQSLNHPASPKPEPDIVVAKVRGADGTVDWSLEYPELSGSDRPAIRLLPDGDIALGSEPKAVVKLKPDGTVDWARSLEALPFQRGLKERPDVGSLLHYRTIGFLPDGDIIFSGVYNLSWVSYKAFGALLCRISGDGDSIRWAERVHSPHHGGETFIRDIVPSASGDSFYAVGFGTEYGADEGDWNHNALVLQMAGGGAMNWVRSIGKKKKSDAQSEYKEEQANAAALGPDGGVIIAGSANSFAHPDPGFHSVIQWQSEHRDLLLTRLGSAGAIANLPIGRWPKMLSAPSPGDVNEVDVLAVPIGLQKLEVEPQKIEMSPQDAQYSLKDENLLTQFDTTTSGTGGAEPVADFKILPQKQEGDRFLRLDGTLSTPPEGRGIVSYKWSFSDTTPQVTATGPKPSYNYKLAYTQDVTLVVTDNCGYDSKPCTKKVVYGNIVRDKGIQPGTCSGKEVNYRIEILTGDVQDAGTDALVDVCLYGKPDDRGQRQSSGEAFIGPSVGTKASNCFEQGQLDTFDLTNQGSEMKWDVDDVDYLSLRHTNMNQHAEWYVRGVKVTNLTTKKEWLFVPDRWLADNKEPDHKTYGQFKPEPAYPHGIIIGGDKKSVGLTEASDNIFILPAGISKFYVTPAIRDVKFTLRTTAGVTLDTRYTGSSQLVYPFLKKAEWGYSFKTSDLGYPTRLIAVFDQEGSERIKSVWVFPSNWTGYETEARRIALLYPMDGRTSLLSCGTGYEAYLIARGKDASKKPDMSPIIDYGLAAFGLFGDIPDARLRWYLEHNTEQYSKYKLDKVLGVLKRWTNDAAFQAMISEYFDMLDLLVKARNWGERLPDVITITTDPVFGGDLVTDLGSNNPNLIQAAKIMEGLKTQMDKLIAAVRGDPTQRIAGNDPASCRTILSTIRTLCVGPNPSSTAVADHTIDGRDYGLSIDIQYPLAVVFGLALSQIEEWEADGGVHPLFSTDYYQKIRADPRYQLDPHGATLYAMGVYRPVIEAMIQVASPLIDVSLMVDEKDPFWFK